MARDDDDDDSLPPLGENTDKFLDQAKKGQARNFLLVCKGNKVKYLAVRKKPIKKNELNEAKKAGYKGEGYFGVITGKGMELVFNLSTADGYTAEPVKDKILKDFLEEKADFKCKPTIAIVATLPDVPFDEEDLKNPLIARFIALDVPITQVLYMNPNAEGELKQTTSEIRGLLQDGDFNTAEPRIIALEARLQALLNGAPANTPQPAPTTPTQPSPLPGPTQQSSPSPTTNVPPPAPPTPNDSGVDNDALKQKLQEALNKLVPKLKQAVTTYPDKKVELLTPVAQIKNQLDSGDLQEAKKGILAVGQLLKSVLAQSASQNQNETQSHSDDALRAEYERKLAALQPEYDRALKEQLGDTSKFKTVMAYASEQAEAGVYGNAIKAIDRLAQAIATAIAAGKATPKPEAQLSAAWMEVKTIWQDASDLVDSQIARLQSVLKSSGDTELVEIAEFGLNAITGNFKVRLMAAIRDLDNASGDSRSKAASKLNGIIQGFRKHIVDVEQEKVAAVDANPFGVNMSIQSTLSNAFDKMEKAIQTYAT